MSERSSIKRLYGDLLRSLVAFMRVFVCACSKSVTEDRMPFGDRSTRNLSTIFLLRVLRRISASLPPSKASYDVSNLKYTIAELYHS